MSAPAGGMPFRPAPDGSSIANLPIPSVLWSHGAFAGGRPAPPENAGSFDATWADDSSHLCYMTSNPDHSGTAWVIDAAGAWSEVANAGTWVMNGGGPSIAACSWTAQRLVVRDITGGNGETSTFWVFSMDGRLLLTKHLPVETWDIFTFSVDASTYADYNESTGDTTVYDLAGNQLAALKGRFIEAFSWSGQLALVMDSESGTRPIHNPYLMDWRQGKVLWRTPGPTMLDTGNYGEVALQPQGDGIALPIDSTACVNQARCNPALYVVSPKSAWRFDGYPYLTWPVGWP